MDYSILEMVQQCLRGIGFTVSKAYPGQVFPQINGVVAAVHIEKVERDDLAVTIEINIICPASMGGTQCEMEALRATEALRTSGAVCIQNGCSYDGVAQVYMVSILATYTGHTEANYCRLWPGFNLFVDNEYLRYAVEFSTERIREITPVHNVDTVAAAGYVPGREVYKIRCEELIPSGEKETEDPDEPFTVRVVSSEIVEDFSGCRWNSSHRVRNRHGLHKIREGYAMSREVTQNGTAV